MLDREGETMNCLSCIGEVGLWDGKGEWSQIDEVVESDLEGKTLQKSGERTR